MIKLGITNLHSAFTVIRPVASLYPELQKKVKYFTRCMSALVVTQIIVDFNVFEM